MGCNGVQRGNNIDFFSCTKSSYCPTTFTQQSACLGVCEHNIIIIASLADVNKTHFWAND